MEEDQILAFYGDDKCEFFSSCKNKFTYVSLDLKFKVFGHGGYRCEFKKIMTVRELSYQIDILELELLGID